VDDPAPLRRVAKQDRDSCHVRAAGPGKMNAMHDEVVNDAALSTA
jgi:hypothetical protein